MFGRSDSIRLFTVRGIRVGVDASWFIVLFLMIYLLSAPFRTTLGSSDTVAYITTVVAVLALFASIIIHELGHAVAARRRGVGVTRIDLNVFGGLTHMSREPANPSEDFTIAAAGPLATIVVILVCLGVNVAIVGGHRLTQAIELDAEVHITPVLLALSWLIPVNLLLLVFNLLPAFPLDGGKIARAAVWRITGDKRRATVASARLGQLLALVMFAFGVYLLIDVRSFGGLYTLGLAWILYSSARATIARTALDDRVEGVSVAEIMDSEPVAIDADLTVEQALQQFFWRYRWSWFPVVTPDGAFTGVVRQPDAQAAADGGEGWVRVSSLIADGTARCQISIDSPIVDLLGSETLRQLGALMVVDGDGVLCGVVTVEQVRRALTSVLSV